MNKNEIMKILPHRDPILLVDRVILKEENKIIAEKDITTDLKVLKGHFPNYPIYPGVYIIEGMAQAAGIMLLKENETPLFLGIDNARFKKEVRPDCVLRYEVFVKEVKASVVFVEGKAYVDNQLVAKATLMLGKKG
ncbi:hydroxymyristoyl-ACP dehydratase [Thermosipho melanesiensis]|uniref:3-hydroxyacyl-[acyl-carrier-protein] dehydratase n=2 Tax=Thermosipho melanesiensis TaxID=46541 RepID=A6LNC9_THEM4|nr:3-hydroxyacyl-ACP dehydratase FabZ [Thermosipho melanesiensis]ABR31430.1 Beta-hydroxyacyl-(acyl-carrier-protein) dehydratase, FabA/FabZ [Thermosipho melanesiensis BI429]APT74489.1 hydroxymyristoyl-ACP dehydratase [Thermosipho melanesiensis]OOC36448.1 hydroxymyristoyl-ACP dehydratase [Thermosipho melanesiensis]OOC37266.1 hydroxymyristoyl-ACP dehydratase [Thermosipho melanesiensis]OOC38018.1 hydroxymyristoyl-ACP dehydratase [Thermosipho melanesiensis]